MTAPLNLAAAVLCFFATIIALIAGIWWLVFLDLSLCIVNAAITHLYVKKEVDYEDNFM
jgi:hypothetical protein